jgi:hypothetical protein
MKLTPELLAQASAGLNPVKERQLDLRGKQIQISAIFNRPITTQDTKSQALKIWESPEYVSLASVAPK